jgi:hypothetical protein
MALWGRKGAGTPYRQLVPELLLKEGEVKDLGDLRGTDAE